MRATEHPFSDLLRRPKEVTDDVEDGDVLLRRRDEPDLRLSRADREALADAFPWLEFLPATDRRVFLDEFTRVVTAAAAVDNYEPLTRLVHEWRATAEVHADPRLARRLRRSLEAAGDRVAPPAG